MSKVLSDTKGTISNKAVSKIDKYNGNIDNLEERLFLIVIDMDDLQIRENLKEELYIDANVPAEVISEMSKSPQRFAYWSALLEEVLYFESSQKVDYDIWFNKHYNDLISMSEFKRSSDTRIERIIAFEQKDEYQIWKKKFSEINRAKSRLKVVINAYEHKIDLLRSIGAMIRLDLQNTI